MSNLLSFSSFPNNLSIKYNTAAVRVEGKINVHIIVHTHDDESTTTSYLLESLTFLLTISISPSHSFTHLFFLQTGWLA